MIGQRDALWTWMLKRILLPLGGKLTGQRIMERLQFLQEAQWWPLDRLDLERNRMLRGLIGIVHDEVPFYRKLMDTQNVKPSDINTSEDLGKLPIVDKQMLRASFPHSTCRNTGRRTYDVFTSGSTGKNFCVKLDNETTGWYRASFLLALEWAGWRIGERHLQTGMSPHRTLEKFLKDTLFRCHYVRASDLSDRRLDLNLELLERYRIQQLSGYPGSLYFLARRALEKGWNLPMRSIATWGDNLYQEYRKTIESAFRTRVFDTYGCAEGLQIAAQCGAGDTYHIHMLDVIVEYLDEEGNPVSPEQGGSLIVTRLHPGPMPLIRYRVGDIGVAGKMRTCRCGRGFDIMESIHGRDTDVVLTPEGNRLIVHFFTGILEHFSHIDSFQIVQNRYDSIIVRIVPVVPFPKELCSEIERKLKEEGAWDLKIQVELVKEIPLPPSGKRRFIIREISQESCTSQANLEGVSGNV